MLHRHACTERKPWHWPNYNNKGCKCVKTTGYKKSKSNEGRHEKNGGVKGRDGSAVELDRETGEEQNTVGRTCRKDAGWQATEESGRVGRRQETEDGGKDNQMKRWKSCGQHLTPDKGKKRKREMKLFASWVSLISCLHFSKVAWLWVVLATFFFSEFHYKFSNLFSV